MAKPRDLIHKSSARAPPLEAIDKSPAKAQPPAMFTREQSKSSVTTPPAKAITIPSSAKSTPAREPAAPDSQPAKAQQPAANPTLVPKAPESTSTQRVPSTPRTPRPQVHTPSTSPYASALVQRPPKPCKTHPPHPVASWLRPSPTKLSMAREQAADRNTQERGTEFEGHEEATAARVKRRQEARNEERWRLANETDVGTTGESAESIGNRRIE